MSNWEAQLEHQRIAEMEDRCHLNEPDSPDFDTALEAYVVMVQETINAHYATTYSNLTPPLIVANTRGKVNVKIISQNTHGVDGAVHSFVRRDTGHILKAAGWSQPAKGKRGSIYSVQNGAEALSYSGGIRYLN
jgi:hypothetical protein